MNSLLILPHEIKESSLIILEEDRAKEFHDDHALPKGAKVVASILGGLRGEVEVLEVSQSRVILKGTFELPPLKREPIKLIVAIPRPQTIRKVLQLAASVGVETLNFVQSEATQKSYMQSKMLEHENMRYHMRLGLQQAYDNIEPIVSIHHSIKDLFHNQESQFKGANKFFAHAPRIGSLGDADRGLKKELVNRELSTILAIGPELGWSDYEANFFLEQKFKMVSLGARIYRVEVALAILIGQLQALY